MDPILAFILAISEAMDYTNSVVSIGGTLTGITRQADGSLMITYTPTTGSPIVFNAGIVPAGRSVTNAAIDANGHLILTFDDSTTIDAGIAAGKAEDMTPISNTEIQNIINNL